MATKNQIIAIIGKMGFCPVCGSELKWFGDVGGEFKQCPNGDGIMKVHGKRQGQMLGMLFELTTE